MIKPFAFLASGICLLLFPMLSIADHGNFSVCNKDSNKDNISITMHFLDGSQDKPKTVKPGGQCALWHWTTRSPRDNKRTRLHYATIESSSNNLYVGLVTRKQHIAGPGKFTLGNITDIHPWKNISMLPHSIHRSAKWKGNYETVQLTIEKTSGFHPPGSAFSGEHISCFHLKRKGNALSARCNAVVNEAWMDVQDQWPNQNDTYEFRFDGEDILNKGMKAGVISNRVSFVTSTHLSMADKKNESKYEYEVSISTYLKGKGREKDKTLYPGSYLHTCPMAYYDAKNKIIYAACAEGELTLHGRLYYDKPHARWYDPASKKYADHNPPTLAFKVNELDISNKTCADIINTHGTISCVEKKQVHKNTLLLK